MKEIKKTVKDLQTYVGQMGELAEKLDEKQQTQLNEILRSLLILLVSLRKSSHLGEFSINFITDGKF